MTHKKQSSSAFNLYEAEALKMHGNGRAYCHHDYSKFRRCLAGWEVNSSGTSANCDNEAVDLAHCMIDKRKKELLQPVADAYILNPVWATKQGIAPSAKNLFNIKIPILLSFKQKH